MRHSYPDWVAETWWEEWGADEALALMRRRTSRRRRGARRRDRGGARRRPHRSGESSSAARSGRRAAGRSWPAPPWTSSRARAGPVRGARREDDAARPRRRRSSPWSSIPAGLGSWTRRAPARVRERPRRERRRARARAGADRVRPVLVDAPCSGLGVLAARPDLRWRARPLPELQAELLRVAAERVKRAAPSSTGLHDRKGGENEDAASDRPPACADRRSRRHGPSTSTRTAWACCSRCRTGTARRDSMPDCFGRRAPIGTQSFHSPCLAEPGPGTVPRAER